MLSKTITADIFAVFSAEKKNYKEIKQQQQKYSWFFYLRYFYAFCHMVMDSIVK